MEDQPALNSQNQQTPVNQASAKPGIGWHLAKSNYCIIGGIILILLLIFSTIYVRSLPSRKPISPPPKPLVFSQPSSPTSTPDSTANWKTYNNAKYEFKIKYPNSWKVTTRGQGEAVSATGNEDTFSIRDDMIEEKGIYFNIASLGSERLGSYYSSAKNLNDYTNLIAKKDENGNIIRRLVKESTVDGRRALWFELYEWKVDKQAFVWTPEIYFQDKNSIYQVNPSAIIDLKLLDQILSTFKLLQQSPSVTCIPRPACLDAVPRCLIPESKDMCPPKPTSSQVVCTQDAKQCPDGSYVSRQPPNCEFAKCP